MKRLRSLTGPPIKDKAHGSVGPLCFKHFPRFAHFLITPEKNLYAFAFLWFIDPTMRSILALEDGKIFHGRAFASKGTATGEVCFNTTMTGYQEALTDPSYRGQILALTYPLIGNYGVNTLDVESDVPHVRGFAIGELSPLRSNWRSEADLGSWLESYGIPGIEELDTRALTRHLRTRGVLRGCITSELTEKEAVEAALASPSMEGADFVREVTCSEPYEWDPDGTLSRKWTVVKGQSSENICTDSLGNAFIPVPEPRATIVAYDFGVKRNILRRLRQVGLRVMVVPAHTPAEEVLAMNPDGVFLSNGPGDPAALSYAHENARKLIGRKPLFGICLGHQILGCAYGARTFKLKFGHRGGNQPVRDTRTGQVAITSQNHGFAVDPESLPPEVEVTHIHLNDGTVAGMRHREHPVFSVQYHPEASPGPQDTHTFFSDFAKEVETRRSG